MSRVGKHAIPVPTGVTVEIAGNLIKATGGLGALSFAFSKEVTVSLEGQEIFVRPNGTSDRERAMWGTTRNQVSNLIQGVSKGFTVDLEINGVGYRAAVQGKDLVLQLGFSHDIKFPIPAGVTIKCEKPTSIQIHGKDRQEVGQIAAQIRGYKSPEPYKGKGIKYVSETIFRKEGKKK
ncbi:MAG: 50S ribosomal protein L6 [Proteobacteria bacterium]|nr:50S ribosomal protein L6 [Pseudomonadota bacterium]